MEDSNVTTNTNEKIDMKQMKDLIPIYTDNSGRQVVDAQELYDALELKGRGFTYWIQDKLLRMEAKEGVDYAKLFLGKSGNGDTYLYQITLDIAKRLATIAGATCDATSRTLKISNAMQLYFLECERQLSGGGSVSKTLPKTYAEALRQLADEVEKNEKLEEENAVLKPKGDYYDSVLDPQDENFKKLITMTEIAKDLGFSSAKTFNKKLNELGLIYKQGNTWHLYSNYEWLIQEKYFDYQISEYGQTLKAYEKGREWLIQFLHEHGVDCKPVKKLFEIECQKEMSKTDDESFGYLHGFLTAEKHFKFRKMRIGTTQASEANKKPVVGVHVKTGKVVRFNSIKEAVKTLGINQGNISGCIKGRPKTAGGYKWYYASEYNEEE